MRIHTFRHKKTRCVSSHSRILPWAACLEANKSERIVHTTCPYLYLFCSASSFYSFRGSRRSFPFLSRVPFSRGFVPNPPEESSGGDSENSLERRKISKIMTSMKRDLRVTVTRATAADIRAMAYSKPIFKRPRSPGCPLSLLDTDTTARLDEPRRLNPNTTNINLSPSHAPLRR